MGHGVPVRMAVDFRRRAVGRPAGVGDGGVRLKGLCEVWLGGLDGLLQLDDLAHGLVRKDLVLLVAVDREAGGIVAAVFESGEACDGEIGAAR